jgi:hypothetical protein
MIDYLDTGEWLRLDTASGASPLIPASREQRSAARTAVAGSAALMPVHPAAADTGRLQVALRDVSCFGLGLVSDTALQPGSQWRVEFLADAKRLGEHLVSVRYCTPLKSMYVAGVQFCIGPELLQRLGADAAPAAPA